MYLYSVDFTNNDNIKNDNIKNGILNFSLVFSEQILPFILHSSKIDGSKRRRSNKKSRSMRKIKIRSNKKSRSMRKVKSRSIRKVKIRSNKMKSKKK